MVEAEPSRLRLDISASTSEVLHPEFFTPNSTDENEDDDTPGSPITIYHAIGNIKENPRSLDVSLRIFSDAGVRDPIQINSDEQGNFFLHTGQALNLEMMSLVEFADFSLRAANINAETRKNFFEHTSKRGNLMYRTLITSLWAKLAELSGTVTRTTMIDQKLKSTETDITRRAKLSYEATESPKHSSVKMVLEHVIEHIELDVEEAYTLVLEYKSGSKNPSTADAKKYVLSGIDSMQLTSARAAYRSLGDPAKKLDIDADPNLVTLFVDTFDELLSA
jgi:hypothetical protein